MVKVDSSGKAAVPKATIYRGGERHHSEVDRQRLARHGGGTRRSLLDVQHGEETFNANLCVPSGVERVVCARLVLR